MNEYCRREASKFVFWILLLCGTFVIGEQSNISGPETLEASSYVYEGKTLCYTAFEVQFQFKSYFELYYTSYESMRYSY